VASCSSQIPELERWRANPEAVVQTRVYDVLDGARPTGGPSFNAAAYSSDGRVWFCDGICGRDWWTPPGSRKKRSRRRHTSNRSSLTEREFKATPNLKIPPNPRDLQIDYTSPTFSIPQKVKVPLSARQLWTADWHEAGTRRQAFYTDLPPGEYSFRVIACNSDGVWNESAAKLDFYVAPAYYQTNWFRALCAAVFLALLWATYQLRVRHLHKQFEMTLEARASASARGLRVTCTTHFCRVSTGCCSVSRRLATCFRIAPRKQLRLWIPPLIRAEQALDEGRHSIQGCVPTRPLKTTSIKCDNNRSGTSFFQPRQGRLTPLRSDRGRRATGPASDDQG